MICGFYNIIYLADLHLSLQYLTVSQVFSHFLRQENSRPQVAQGFAGRYDLLPLCEVFPEAININFCF